MYVLCVIKCVMHACEGIHGVYTHACMLCN